MSKSMSTGYGAKGDVRTKASKYGRGKAGTVSHRVPIHSECAESLVACLNAILDAGDALMFSRTSSGGILCLAAYSPGCDPAKYYCRDAEELEVALAELENAARDAT